MSIKVMAHRLPHNFHNLSEKDQERVKTDNLKGLIKKFRRSVNESKVLQFARLHERYEKPSEKKRRLRRSRQLELLKEQRNNNKRR